VETARREAIGILLSSAAWRGRRNAAVTSGTHRRSSQRETRRSGEDRVNELASEKGITPGQLALAWFLGRGDDIVPIPGTKRRERLEENAKAADVELTG
jgi:aryl-alcohol dehydrogenase-like predicted oxidoreductase